MPPMPPPPMPLANENWRRGNASAVALPFCRCSAPGQARRPDWLIFQQNPADPSMAAFVLNI
jgi:hypothetical protein